MRFAAKSSKLAAPRSLALLALALVSTAMAQEVRVEVKTAAPNNAKVTKAHSYDAMVTLS